MTDYYTIIKIRTLENIFIYKLKKEQNKKSLELCEN